MKIFIVCGFLLISSFSYSSSGSVSLDKQVNLQENMLRESLKKVLKVQSSFSVNALVKAYRFLDKNYDYLKKKNLCLNKDNIRNRKLIRNKSCLIIVDYTKSKRKPRLLFVNPKTGDSELFYTAHGKGSHKVKEIESGHIASRFSNISGSNMTSLGFYLTDKIYQSFKETFGPRPINGLKMDGLNCSNNNARKRYVVMHTADYVQSINGDPLKNGNSEGCVTIPEMRKDILLKCKGGALVYAHYE